MGLRAKTNWKMVCSPDDAGFVCCMSVYEEFIGVENKNKNAYATGVIHKPPNSGNGFLQRVHITFPWQSVVLSGSKKLRLPQTNVKRKKKPKLGLVP